MLLPSEKPARRLQDIVDNAEAIARYTEGMNETSFAENRLVYDAVERCLERISEAIAKIGDEAAELLPGQPWYKIRSFGNVLRHEYDEIIEDRIWEIVKDDLPSLLEATKEALKRFSRT